MSNLLLYVLVSIGILIVLFIAGCLYLAVRYSDDEDDDYNDDVRWN